MAPFFVYGGFAALVAGIYLNWGAGWALCVGGLLMFVAGNLAEQRPKG